ncbi:hypothetical protein J3E07_001650 [Methanococcus voltae]|uniref:Uncharacterized protein n=1 Tax=Methanococcus voltae TaxID=2188 RepID=A0A8J7UTZ9_METVO|nr:hypothetical protein [Methanococcus voltae]MBP2202209.1 hypothetical protein [Methanococcus voltae]
MGLNDGNSRIKHGKPNHGSFGRVNGGSSYVHSGTSEGSKHFNSGSGSSSSSSGGSSSSDDLYDKFIGMNESELTESQKKQYTYIKDGSGTIKAIYAKNGQKLAGSTFIDDNKCSEFKTIGKASEFSRDEKAGTGTVSIIGKNSYIGTYDKSDVKIQNGNVIVRKNAKLLNTPNEIDAWGKTYIKTENNEYKVKNNKPDKNNNIDNSINEINKINDTNKKIAVFNQNVEYHNLLGANVDKVTKVQSERFNFLTTEEGTIKAVYDKKGNKLSGSSYNKDGTINYKDFNPVEVVNNKLDENSKFEDKRIFQFNENNNKNNINTNDINNIKNPEFKVNSDINSKLEYIDNSKIIESEVYFNNDNNLSMRDKPPKIDDGVKMINEYNDEKIPIINQSINDIQGFSENTIKKQTKMQNIDYTNLENSKYAGYKDIINENYLPKDFDLQAGKEASANIVDFTTLPVMAVNSVRAAAKYGSTKPLESFGWIMAEGVATSALNFAELGTKTLYGAPTTPASWGRAISDVALAKGIGKGTKAIANKINNNIKINTNVYLDRVNSKYAYDLDLKVMDNSLKFKNTLDSNNFNIELGLNDNIKGVSYSKYLDNTRINVLDINNDVVTTNTINKMGSDVNKIFRKQDANKFYEHSIIDNDNIKLESKHFEIKNNNNIATFDKSLELNKIVDEVKYTETKNQMINNKHTFEEYEFNNLEGSKYNFYKKENVNLDKKGIDKRNVNNYNEVEHITKYNAVSENILKADELKNIEPKSIKATMNQEYQHSSNIEFSDELPTNKYIKQNSVQNTNSFDKSNNVVNEKVLKQDVYLNELDKTTKSTFSISEKDLTFNERYKDLDFTETMSNTHTSELSNIIEFTDTKKSKPTGKKSIKSSESSLNDIYKNLDDEVNSKNNKLNKVNDDVNSELNDIISTEHNKVINNKLFKEVSKPKPKRIKTLDNNIKNVGNEVIEEPKINLKNNKNNLKSNNFNTDIFEPIGKNNIFNPFDVNSKNNNKNLDENKNIDNIINPNLEKMGILNFNKIADKPLNVPPITISLQKTAQMQKLKTVEVAETPSLPNIKINMPDPVPPTPPKPIKIPEPFEEPILKAPSLPKFDEDSLLGNIAPTNKKYNSWQKNIKWSL